MKNRCVFSLSSAFALLLFLLPAELLAGEPRELFNGKDLSGWYIFLQNREKNSDPNGVFTVHDGLIHVTGEEFGGITTEESFSDYRLTVEFKWGEKTWGGRKERARDSGVLIHSFGPDGGFAGLWMRSVEANITEGGIGDFWIVGGKNDGISATCRVRIREDGRIFDPERGEPLTITSNGERCFQWIARDSNWKDDLNFRGAKDIDRPGDWNELTVEARSDVMETFLNGTLVNRVYDLKPTAGKIQLQSEGAEIFFRRVTLTPLDD